MGIRVLTTLLLLLSGSLIGGCSTVKMYSDDSITPGPYVGTKKAIIDTKRHWQHYDYYGQVFVYAVDVPLCLIADTLILPYAVYNSYHAYP